MKIESLLNSEVDPVETKACATRSPSPAYSHTPPPTPTSLQSQSQSPTPPIILPSISPLLYLSRRHSLPANFSVSQPIPPTRLRNEMFNEQRRSSIHAVGTVVREQTEEQPPRRRSLPTIPSANSSGKKQHICDVPGCGKNFSTSGHLSRHRRLHNGTKPYGCPIPYCSSKFARHDNMLQHYRGHVKKLSGGVVGTLPRGRRGSLPVVSL